MNSNVSYRVETKENVYFAIGLVFSVVFYAVVVTGLIMSVDMGMEAYLGVFAFYAVFILLLLHLLGGLLVGMIRGNAVKLGPEQFPDIHATVLRQSQQLGLGRVPDVYLLQAGGVLNAFATRFMGKDFIVLYSDILEEAYEQNRETVDFVIAHELGHVKRNHLVKRKVILPALLIPFFSGAYSRACEYTCDSIGASLSGEDGARSGLTLLAAGKRLFRRVNVGRFVQQNDTEAGFWYWFAEKLSTHPHLAKRLARFPERITDGRPKAQSVASWEAPMAQAAQPEEVAGADHSKYFPKG